MAQTFEVTVLGTGSAKPTSRRLPSAQWLKIGSHKFLIDCGEGTQMQLMKLGIGFNNVNAIFISHLHGDHLFGLPGYINTLSLHNRSKGLKIYGPPGIKDLINLVLHLGRTTLSFEIEYIEIPKQAYALLVDEYGYKVYSVALKHRVECYGYIFEECGPERKINVEACEELNIPFTWYERLRKGQNYTAADGTEINFEELTIQGPPNRRYAYMSDTIYDPSIAPYLAQVNLLYHEATFAHELQARAKETFHSTAIQAALIAQMAEAKHLLIGHFSSRYDNVEPLKAEALSVFKNTEIATEGSSYTIK